MKICVDKNSSWEYTKPAPLNHKILLLTLTNQCVVGCWKGPVIGSAGQQFKAWKGLPDRDRDLEQKMEYL